MNKKGTHPKRFEMIHRCAVHFGITEKESYEELEHGIKRLFSYHSYIKIIEPMVLFDVVKKGRKCPQMANKYGITVNQVEYLMKKYKKGKSEKKKIETISC